VARSGKNAREKKLIGEGDTKRRKERRGEKCLKNQSAEAARAIRGADQDETERGHSINETLEE